MRPEAADGVFQVIISATDPKRTAAKWIETINKPSTSLTKLALVLFSLMTSVGLRGQSIDVVTTQSSDRQSEYSALERSIQNGDWGNIHAVAISRHGSVLHEGYYAGSDERLGSNIGTVTFGPDSRHDIRSISKTITAILVGIAIERGEIKSETMFVSELLPSYSELLVGEKSTITLHHVLTMTAGLQWDEESLPYSDPKNDERQLSRSADPVRYVLERDLVSVPGANLNYSGGLTHILAAIVTEATGKPLDEYANEVLFEPLGIENWEWMNSGSAVPSAFSGLRMTARDLLKIGDLFLNLGRHNERQIVPESWIVAATKPHIYYDDSEAPKYVKSNGYGYQIWTNDFVFNEKSYFVATAIGNGGQRIILYPDLGLAIVVLAGFYNDSSNDWTPEEMVRKLVLLRRN